MATRVLALEDVFTSIAGISGDQKEYRLFVPPGLAFEGKAIAVHSAMQLILERMMDLGFSFRSLRPMGTGCTFRYCRWFSVARSRAEAC